MAALQRGEIDWLLTPNADLVDSLRKSPGVTVRVAFPLGSVSCLRFNWLQPPFDRAEIRRAVLPAIIQADYMTAMNGDDRTRWRDNVGYFCPGMPMANDAGLEALTGPRSLEAARRNLAAAGYKGERVVLLAPGDVPYAKILAEVTADLLKRTGFNVDLQAMDWGTLVQRRAKQDPLDKGGWSVFHTNWTGADQGTPATHVFLRGNGRAAAPGWPDIPRMEQLRDAWLGAADQATQLGIAREMQALAFQEIPYIPLGQMISATAHRSDLVGMVPNQVAFWNVRRAGEPEPATTDARHNRGTRQVVVGAAAHRRRRGEALGLHGCEQTEGTGCECDAGRCGTGGEKGAASLKRWGHRGLSSHAHAHVPHG